MVDVTVAARNDAGSPGAVKLQGETWELNIWATTDELWTLAGIENTDWAQRRTLKVGTCAGAPVWQDELDGTVNILVGHDAETWDMGVTIPLGTVHEILAELGEPPEVTPPPFGPTLFQRSQDAVTVLTAVIPVLLQVLYLACFGQGGGEAANVGLNLGGDGVAEPSTMQRHTEQELARWPGLDGDEMAQRRARASMQAALERARELGITRTDREALGPLPEGFSRCCPQPGYRCGCGQG